MTRAREFEGERLDEIGATLFNDRINQFVAHRCDEFGLPALQRPLLERVSDKVAVGAMLSTIHSEDGWTEEQAHTVVVSPGVKRLCLPKDP